LSDLYFLDKKYTTIITNPPFSAGKKVVQWCIQQAYDHLTDWGVVWIVVPTNKWAKSYINYTQEIFGSEKVKIIALEAGYRVWTATK
jgi:16S rRNA (guanine1207-N2)-methyltransferase